RSAVGRIRRNGLTPKGDFMALVPCPECGRQVSTKAEACPQCGCPLASKIAALEASAHLQLSDSVVPPPQGDPDMTLFFALGHLGAFLDGSKLSVNDIAVHNLQAIKGLCSSAVTGVDISGGEAWRDHHLDQLSQLFPDLCELTIRGCNRLTDESLYQISKLLSLNKLDLLAW